MCAGRSWKTSWTTSLRSERRSAHSDLHPVQWWKFGRRKSSLHWRRGTDCRYLNFAKIQWKPSSCLWRTDTCLLQVHPLVDTADPRYQSRRISQFVWCGLPGHVFESVGHQLNVFCVFSHFWKQQKSLQSDLDSLTRPGSELWSLPPLGSRDEWWYWLVASVCGMQSTWVDRLTISNYNLSRTQGFSATVQGKTKGATNLWNPTATKKRFY